MSTENRPEYYIKVPSQIRYDRRLKPAEKLMYGEILALSHKMGYCFATNTYFSDLYEVSLVTISNWISDLEEFGYIHRELIYADGSKEVVQRRLWVKDLIDESKSYENDENISLTGTKENDNTLLKENLRPSINNFEEGVKENFKDNTINTNNISNNIKNTNNISADTTSTPVISKNKNKYEKEKEIKATIECVVGYLNEVCGTKFRTSSSETQKLIKARLKEDFTLQDFKDVIEYKYYQWGKKPIRFSDGAMSDTYLRPSTLFGTRFETYLFESHKNNKYRPAEKSSEGIDNDFGEVIAVY